MYATIPTYIHTHTPRPGELLQRWNAPLCKNGGLSRFFYTKFHKAVASIAFTRCKYFAKTRRTIYLTRFRWEVKQDDKPLKQSNTKALSLRVCISERVSVEWQMGRFVLGRNVSSKREKKRMFGLIVFFHCSKVEWLRYKDMKNERGMRIINILSSTCNYIVINK